MRKIIIVNDKNRDILFLQDYLNAVPNTTVTGIYATAGHALPAILENKADVVIAQVDTLACLIEKNRELPLLVCLSTDATMLSAQLARSIFAYLHPPFSHAQVLSLLQNIDAYMFQLSNAGIKKDYVFIKSEYKLIRVNLADILYLSGLRDYTQVFLRGRPSPLTTLQNLKDFESKLPDDNFIRVHRSYIVSLAHVDAVSRNEISIGAHIIPIGNAYRQVLDNMISRNS